MVSRGITLLELLVVLLLISIVAALARPEPATTPRIRNGKMALITDDLTRTVERDLWDEGIDRLPDTNV